MPESDRAIEALVQRTAVLEAENAYLKERIDFLEGMRVLNQGMKGETLISQLVGGKITTHIAPHDVDAADGTRLEVKFSRLTTPMPGCRTCRWNWGYALGLKRNKAYDRLILIGIADPRYAEHYMDPDSPYVLFDVPLSDVSGLLRGDMIAITTDPTVKRPGRRRTLFETYQVTRGILGDRYGLT